MKRLFLFVVILLAFCLRIYQLDSNPPAFYSDEASWAYNAYAIMQTGKDEYGRILPWVFEAFGDYKLPVTVYSIVPSFFILGVSNWSARLPTAVYGVLSVYALYILVIEIQKLKQQNNEQDYTSHQKLALLSALLLAIAPAHIFLSRGIWDIQPALFFITLGATFYLKAIRHIHLHRNPLIQFSIAAISFVLSTYSYNSARVIAPLLVIFLTVLFYKTLTSYVIKKGTFKKYFSVILPVCLGLFLLLPQIQSLRDPAVTQRAKYVSIFNRGDIEAQIYGATSADGIDQQLWLVRLLHNKPVFYASEILQRYLQHFNLNYLFLTGDTFEIFKVEGVGVLPLVTLPFFFIGLVSLIKDKAPYRWVILGWLLIAPIPSSLTVFTPSVSRAHNMIIPLVIITAYGILALQKLITEQTNRYQRIYQLAVISLLLLNTWYWHNQYFILTPMKVAHKWGSGWSEVTNYLSLHQNEYDHIFISNAQGPSYIWLAWYQQRDPHVVWQTRQTDFKPDSNGLNNTYKMDKYQFTKNINQDCVLTEHSGKSLCIGYGNEIHNPSMRIMADNHVPAFDILSK